jgi:hypothetical protein
MKTIYNVIKGTQCVDAWGADVKKEYFDREECEFIETPKCILRVMKKDLADPMYIAFIKRYFCAFRRFPLKRNNRWTVQASPKHGRWYKVGRMFYTEEEANAIVIERNELLKPFVNSPFCDYTLEEIDAFIKECES